MASETLRGLTTPYRAESIDAFREVLQVRRSVFSGRSAEHFSSACRERSGTIAGE
jgi:hypothetical protein